MSQGKSRLGLARPMVWSMIALAAGALSAPDAAWAAQLGQESASGEASQVWPMLLAMLAASTGVERLIELLWNYSDWFLLNARGWQPAHLRSAQYVQFKSGTSLLLGVVMGILIANALGMQFLYSLAPFAPNLLANVPAGWDIVITGLLIGAGAKPVHDLFGIVTGFKNWLGASAIKQREAAGAELAEGVLKLAQSDAQSMIDVPGVGPARLHASSGGLDGYDEEVLEEGAPSVDKYADMLRNRTAL
ncbi:MAG: hypothetical protein HC802_01550 [Caldilineaceae bacterium]|nr:hypothetical protein [Caldilineaceae bacterium]